MSKVLIVYGSTTGNTEALAEILGRLIQEAGHETTLLNAADASAPGLCDGWDMILFGCSAWGDDEIILQDDFDALFQQFDLINAKGHKVACFATGDSNFTYFCGAVDVIEAALERLGADVVVEGLKIDGQAQSDQPEIQEWTKAVIETLPYEHNGSEPSRPLRPNLLLAPRFDRRTGAILFPVMRFLR